MTELEIRDFKPRDLAAVLALQVDATDPGGDPARSIQEWPELLNIPENFQAAGAFLVGASDGELVVMASLRPEQGSVFRVNFVRVAHEHQRTGLASRMMAAIEERAAALGATALVLNTTFEQVAAQRLYESLGYRETHRSVVRHNDGLDYDVINYRKGLATAEEISARGGEIPDWQLDLLEECRVGRLATLAKDGRPHLVPAVYALVEEGIVIPVDEKPKRSSRLARLRNIERDPRVTLLVDRYDDDWTQLAWVRVDGTATIFERGDQAPDALEALRERYPQHRTMALERLPVILIRPERVSGWRWTDQG